MYIFLGYFNKTREREENNELNRFSFDNLTKAIQKILEQKENEDIDYNLCDLVFILSSTFYMADPNAKNEKIYITDVIKKSPIIKKLGARVDLNKFILNEEIHLIINLNNVIKLTTK